MVKPVVKKTVTCKKYLTSYYVKISLKIINKY